MCHIENCVSIKEGIFCTIEMAFWLFFTHFFLQKISTKKNICSKLKIFNKCIKSSKYQNQCTIYSRRHQHYHSQRSTRTVDLNNHHQRPSSTYYEYETLHYNSGNGVYNPNVATSPSNFNHHIALNGSQRKINQNGQTPIKWRTPNHNRNSIRNRGPFVTQVTIREQIPTTNGHPSKSPNSIATNASKV